MALNREAKKAGLYVDQLLADARTLYPPLKVSDYDPASDQADLFKLALWMIRYCPWVAQDGPDSLMLDISGSAHLFGGETGLAEDILNRFSNFGLTTHIALADTIGIAWAMARYSRKTLVIAPEGSRRVHLEPMPVAALRISNDISDRLTQVGLKQIGMILDKPRAPLAARYGSQLGDRLDQALGRKGEVLSPVAEPPHYRTSACFMEPIQHLNAIEVHLADLAESLMQLMKKASVGGRRFDLACYRVDGDTHIITVRTSAFTSGKDLVCRLFSEKLKQFSETYDAGFGFEQLTLSASECELLAGSQIALTDRNCGKRTAEYQTLIDRFSNRFGPESVGHFIPHESHIPEHTEKLVPSGTNFKDHTCWQYFLESLQGENHLGRPILLLPHPEPITAMAEVPDGPPIVFEWRRLKCRITGAEGPERIAPEWWSRQTGEVEPTRDYYRVEDREGYRYWLFRQGLYERHETPSWFMHGFFA